MISKKIILLLALAVMFALSSCKQESTITPYTPAELAAVVAATQEDLPALSLLLWEDADFLAYAENFYGLDGDSLSGGAILHAQGAQATEITVFVLADPELADYAETALTAYKESRVATFTGYAPLQADLAERAILTVRGSYVALFVCENPEAAEAAFLACFSENPPPVPELPESPPEEPEPIEYPAQSTAPAPVEEDVGYDHAAILAAYRGGDETALAAKDREILEKCREIIDSLIREDMSDYEKELAIHDWLVENTRYDEITLFLIHLHDPNNETPYGPLLRGKATCLGYTTAFQLLMDMLELPCITVNGFTRKVEEHAWNMVELDGDWYCVDVTWDDPAGLSGLDLKLNHKYFNVTSDFLRETDHQWDENGVPEATAVEYAWRA
jgi:hypothetical protein